MTISEIIAQGASHRAQRLTLGDLRHLKVCSWDIEASGLDLDFGLLLCVGIKELGGELKLWRLDESPGYHERPWDDGWLAEQARNELERYQVVVHHYGDRFDVPALNTRLIRWRKRLLETNNMCFVDTWWNAQKRLKLHSNRLASLIAHLDTKITKTGLDGPAWTEAVAGRRSALGKIVTHNIRDVKALEEVLVRMAAVMPLRYTYLK